MPEVTASVCPPRVAAIEYPLGCSFGQPGDSAGQTAVLRATLQALTEFNEAGLVVHLPFTWPEPPKKYTTILKIPHLLPRPSCAAPGFTEICSLGISPMTTSKASISEVNNPFRATRFYRSSSEKPCAGCIPAALPV